MLQNFSLWRVFGVFCKFPTTELSVADIGRESKLTYPAVLRHIKTLQDKEIITKRIQKKGEREFPVYKANYENDTYRHWKKVFNRESVQKLVDEIDRRFGPACIILFGSYGRGEDIESSDIDLCIIGKKHDFPLDSFEKELHREIQLHRTERFTDYSENLRKNVANGFILRGFLNIYDAKSDS